MQIDWQIMKKRGNHRPRLIFTITLESFERDLAMDAVHVETRIPEIPAPHESFCLPGKHERHPEWTPVRFHRLQVPWFKTGKISAFIRLPFRDTQTYPEVEAGFRALRAAFEAKVCEAYAQSPIDTRESLGISDGTRQAVAARVTANRILALFNIGKINGKDRTHSE